ncbi:MAG: PcfJ domain-containing protein [Piscinibacter sp.]|nr:PcfJ domain-containing protein [Piscinibacter sp.]
MATTETKFTSHPLQPTRFIMKRSMIQRRQDAERERIELCDAALRRVVRRARPVPDFSQAIEEAERGFSGEVMRDPQSWHPQMKTRDAARLRLAAARHLFALYPVPAMLERIWIDDTGLGADEVRLRRQWYVTAARGGSLYKAGAGNWLTRKEVHAFLHPSAGLGFDEAFWEAIARSYAVDNAMALRIARSKIARAPRGEIEFWRTVVRFFCANPATAETIDDLCDYLAECRRRDPGYSLEGRTLPALIRRMHEWHHDIAAIERIEAMRRRAHGRGAHAWAADAAWPGSPLADWEWVPSSKDAKAKGERFVVRQLKQAEDLVMESRAMRHCVSTYAGKCIAGNASIWSLRRCTKDRIDRLLTIEVDQQHRAVQVRGLGNRLAHVDERHVVERWAKARGIALR